MAPATPPAGPPAVVPAGPVMPPATDATAPDADADARVAASPDATAPDATAPACAPMAPAAAPAATPAAVPAAPGAAPAGAPASVPAVLATPVADEPAAAAPAAAAPAVREEGTTAAAASDVEPRGDQGDLSAPKHALHAATVLKTAIGPKHRFRIRMKNGVCTVQCEIGACVEAGVAQHVKPGAKGRALVNFSRDHLGYQARAGIQLAKMSAVHRKAVEPASSDSASAVGGVGAADDDAAPQTAASARARGDDARRGPPALSEPAAPAGAAAAAASSGAALKPAVQSGVSRFREGQLNSAPWTVDYELRTHKGAPWLFCLLCCLPKIQCETGAYRVESNAKQHRGLSGSGVGFVRKSAAKSAPKSAGDITSFLRKPL